MRLHLGGVPLHPALVHLPLACWILSPAADLCFQAGLAPWCWQAAWWLGLGGVLAAVPAALAGALDAWFSRSVTAAQSTVLLHSGLMLVVWSLFGIAAVLCPPQAPDHALAITALVLHLCAFAVLLVAAHNGGRLAYLSGLPRAE